jgi:hypothetical protein
LVEGFDDVLALNHVAAQYKAHSYIDATFEELGIVILPIGGCGSIKNWLI